MRFARTAAIFASAAAWAAPAVSFAQSQAAKNFQGSLDAAAGRAGMSRLGVAALVGNITNVILSVSGIVLMCLLVYGGVLYAVGGQDKDKVAKAKRLIVNAVIGIVIVVAAYAITRFILLQLMETFSAPGVSPT